MNRLVGALSGLLLLLYPFAVYFGIQQLGPRLFGGLLLVLFAVRYLVQRNQSSPLKINFLPLATILGTTFCLLVLVVNEVEPLKFYPVLMNICFFLLFAQSLKTPQPVIERIARIQHPNLSARGVMHARQTTIVWCGFFLLNGSIALYTALASDMKTWTFYNGFLSYAAMGVLFFLEWVVRRARMAQDQRESSAQC